MVSTTDLPVNWSRKKLKYLAREPIRNGIGAPAEHDNSDWPRYIRITDIKGPRELRDDTFKSLPPELARQAPVRRGDILLAAVGATFGKAYLHATDIGPACFAGYLVRFAPGRSTDGRFIAYWTESDDYWKQVNANVIQSTVQNFSAGKYRVLTAPTPPLPTQRALADFLDRKTQAIDGLIRKKERLIELLQEKRQALITQAVTKGLDPNVSMKDSGVPWLGEIPAHWKVQRLKHLTARIVDCPHSTPVYSEDGEFPAIRTADVGRGTLDLASARRVTEAVYRERVERMVPRAGDILYSREGERFGMAALVPDGIRLCLAQRMMVFRVARSNYPAFVMMGLNSEGAFQQVKQDTVGATSPRVNIPTIANMVLAVPPPVEQIEIAHGVDRLTEADDQTGKRIMVQIDRLREYRQALISAAVTGQIEVTTEAAA